MKTPTCTWNTRARSVQAHLEQSQILLIHTEMELAGPPELSAAHPPIWGKRSWQSFKKLFFFSQLFDWWVMPPTWGDPETQRAPGPASGWADRIGNWATDATGDDGSLEQGGLGDLWRTTEPLCSKYYEILEWIFMNLEAQKKYFLPIWRQRKAQC